MAEHAPSSVGSGPVVVGYDGSDESMKAIAFLSPLLPGAETVVVTAWKPISEAILVVALGQTPPMSDLADADARQRRAAENLARDGARRASQMGLRAEAVAVRASGPIWDAIESVAGERGARLVVVGSHGRSRVESMIPGSVAVGLVHHASRPVLVVTAPKAAKERRPDDRGKAERTRGRRI